MQGAWIEMMILTNMNNKIESLPVQGAWIEILRLPATGYCRFVAPRAGSVD